MAPRMTAPVAGEQQDISERRVVTSHNSRSSQAVSLTWSNPMNQGMAHVIPCLLKPIFSSMKKGDWPLHILLANLPKVEPGPLPKAPSFENRSSGSGINFDRIVQGKQTRHEHRARRPIATEEPTLNKEGLSLRFCCKHLIR